VFNNLNFTIMIKIKSLLIATVCGAMFVSCQKTAEPTYADVLQSTKDEALVQSLFEDAQADGEEQHASTEIENGTKSLKELEGPIITVANKDGFLDTTWSITIDYGTGIVGRFGWERKGKIIIDVKGRYKQTNSTRTMTFEDFYINNNKVEGTHKVTTTGYDATKDAYIFNVEVTGAKVTTAENKVITWESNRTRTWLSGHDTPFNILDDVYEISGTANGVNSEGKAFAKTITTPLRIEANCQYIQEGVVTLQVEGVEMGSIDYGYEPENAEECDGNLEITTKNKLKYPVSIKK
jgi:hypothetical protein